MLFVEFCAKFRYNQSVRKYYWILARTSLVVILIQMVVLAVLCANVRKINSFIDKEIAVIQANHAPLQELQPWYDKVENTLTSFQQANKQHNWLLLIAITGAIIHLSIVYSLYIYFLRMGYTWTKAFLHLNNISLALFLPGIFAFGWFILYVVGTRVIKHYCVVSTLSKDEPHETNNI